MAYRRAAPHCVSCHLSAPCSAAWPAAVAPQVYTGLLLVDTAPLKQALLARAAAGEQALLDQLQSKTMEVARRVCARCEELSAKALAEATGVRSVLDLKVRGHSWRRPGMC